MLFNSFVFMGVFLPVTYVVFWLLVNARQRYIWLTITGYVFYGYWDPRFCLLMAFSTLVSYCAGLGFLRWADDDRLRRWCLVVPITVDLSLLGYFKYAGFLVESVRQVVQSIGGDLPITPQHIILPIGISFYTFHTITYIVDSYRRVITPTRNLFEFSAYVSLFSQLVAGPIVRFRQIEQDLENLGQASRTRWLGRGVSFFLIGLIEKVVIADTLAAYVDPTLARYVELSTIQTWLVMCGYAFQLYFDFSGYSTMAVGLGYMFGIRIPQNFDSPYKALDPSDFWKRWHISLSSCLRDYLYIPLGGNRHGEWATYQNLMITMLLGGLWHGANWTFVVWGAYHGALLAIYRRFSCVWDIVPSMLRRGAMFILVVIGWVFFRSLNFTMAAHMLTAMFWPTGGWNLEGSELFVIGLAVAAWWGMVGPNAFDLHERLTWRREYGVALAAAVGVAFAIMLGSGASPFLYFQF